MPENSSENNLLRFLWEKTLENDEQAFAAIHEQLFESLYYYAVKLLKDEYLANDAIQEFFIKLWLKRRSIGKIKNIKAFFYTVLRRQLLNQLRSSGTSLKKIDLLGDLQSSDNFDIQFSPEEIVIRDQEDELLHQKLIQLLNDLPRRQKEVIYLYYFEEMSYDQISTVMGINYQSVLNLIQKALQKLRTQNILAVFLSAILHLHLLPK